MEDVTAEPLDRLRLYAYATARESADYVAIMRRFAGSLLAEWSAHDVADHGLDLPVEVIEQRLRYLEANGNLLLSPREVRVTSIAEYHRQPARYAATSLGVRVHRQVEEVLAAAGGAREVPRELLAAVAHRLTELAETVSTVFLQFSTFAAAVTDFYTYVGSVLARPDLDDDEWSGFKQLLLDYLETIIDAVARHSGTIRIALDGLQPALPDLLARLAASDPEIERLRASSPGGEGIERSRGRALGDWDELRDWFGTGSSRSSGALQLRSAAARAVGALLANVKRMNASASREASLRNHFLRLARWFDSSTPDDAHVLYTSAFGLYGARHLGVPLEPAIADALPSTTSWWRAPAAPVPVSIRERGDRAARGRSFHITDHSAAKQQLLEKRAREAAERQSAVDELLAAGDRLADVKLTGSALTVLLELLARANATQTPSLAGTSATLDDADLTVWVEPHRNGMVLRSPVGDLRLDGFVVTAGRAGRRPAHSEPASSDDDEREAIND